MQFKPPEEQFNTPEEKKAFRAGWFFCFKYIAEFIASEVERGVKRNPDSTDWAFNASFAIMKGYNEFMQGVENRIHDELDKVPL